MASTQPFVVLLFLIFARLLSAHHHHLEAATTEEPIEEMHYCTNSSISVAWEVQNFTVVSTSNTTFVANITNAVPYDVSFTLVNNDVDVAAFCTAQVNSPDGDSGRFYCQGATDLFWTAPAPTSTRVHQSRVGEPDAQQTGVPSSNKHDYEASDRDRSVAYRDDILGAKKNKKSGNSADDDDMEEGEYQGNSNNVEEPEGSDPIHVPDYPGTISKGAKAAATRLRRAADAKAPDEADFRYNRLTGLLNITQQWYCVNNASDGSQYTVNFNASGSANISDLICNPSNDSLQTDQPFVNDNKARPVKLVSQGDGDDGVVVCSPPENYTITPYSMQAWTVGGDVPP